MNGCDGSSMMCVFYFRIESNYERRKAFYTTKPNLYVTQYGNHIGHTEWAILKAVKTGSKKEGGAIKIAVIYSP